MTIIHLKYNIEITPPYKRNFPQMFVLSLYFGMVKKLLKYHPRNLFQYFSFSKWTHTITAFYHLKNKNLGKIDQKHVKNENVY